MDLGALIWTCYVIMDLGALIWPLLCDYGFGTPSFGSCHHGHFYGGLSQENKCHVVYYSQICYYDRKAFRLTPTILPRPLGDPATIEYPPWPPAAVPLLPLRSW